MEALSAADSRILLYIFQCSENMSEQASKITLENRIEAVWALVFLQSISF